MKPLFLSRVTLREDPGVAALAGALMPSDEINANTGHRVMWSLFSGSDTQRDFLWRDEGGGRRYMVLSHREPDGNSPIFRVETKAFEPNLRQGDPLAFHLRVNATVARKDGSRRGKRHDVAMDLLRSEPHGKRAENRERLAEEAARKWLLAHSEGFELAAMRLESYRTLTVPRKGRPARFGVFDLVGTLAVSDPGRFLAQLANGYGRARAFGCGLMLIRRATI